MKFSIDGSGWLEDMRREPSANADDRPDGVEPDLVVLHAISLPPGEFGGSFIDDLFCNRLDCSLHPYFDEIRDLKVSAHALIRRDGTVVQYVPFGRRAWHAGESRYQDREACNDFSIGIELEGDEETPFEEVQYTALAKLIRVLVATYPTLSTEHIVGHSEIAPGRKTDPGPAFDWQRLRELLG